MPIIIHISIAVRNDSTILSRYITQNKNKHKEDINQKE